MNYAIFYVLWDLGYSKAMQHTWLVALYFTILPFGFLTAAEERFLLTSEALRLRLGASLACIFVSWICLAQLITPSLSASDATFGPICINLTLTFDRNSHSTACVHKYLKERVLTKYKYIYFFLLIVMPNCFVCLAWFPASLSTKVLVLAKQFEF